MKKINGVTMNGNIVVDIDKDKDTVIIPEYTEGTTYQLPLNGIKCIQVSSLDLLCKFIGVPKTIILNAQWEEPAMWSYNQAQKLLKILLLKNVKFLQLYFLIH